MRQRQQFHQPSPKLTQHEMYWGHAERLSRVDFGVRESWQGFPKWQEDWLVNFYRDWFEAIESLNQLWRNSNADEHE